MKNYLILVLFLILIPRLTVLSQSGTQNDSTRLVNVEAWRMYRLIHDVQKLKVCNNLVDTLQIQIDKAEDLIASSEGIRIDLDEKVSILEKKVSLIEEQAIIDEIYYKDEIRDRDKKILKTKLIAVLEVVIIIILII